MNKWRKQVMKRYIFFFYAAILTFFAQCDTLKNIPTNTSGGVFSLNGTWQLSTTTDNRALEGTTVSVVPGIAEGSVKSLSNNTYCLRENDVIWKNVKGSQGGSFSIDYLVSACSGKALYHPATMTVLSNDEIRLKGSTANGAELLQTWKRIAQ
jgi:hypothetical protein